MEKIYVWGTGVHAVNFVHLCQDVKIIAYIDNNKRQDTFEIGDVPILLPDVFLTPQTRWEKRFIVIATSETVYWEIKAQLDREGYREFTDYCYYKVYKKKIAVIYGNCHILPIREGLENSEKFSKEYGFYPLRLIQTIYASNGEDLNSDVFQNCDLFIHQEIQEHNKYGLGYSSEACVRKLKSTCDIIAIPNLYGMPKCFFPQIDVNLPERRVRNRAYFSFRDKLIEGWKNCGYDNSYIVDKIRYGNVLSGSELEKKYDEFFDKLLMREKKWDIKISHWISKEIEHVPLFYDVNHPTNEVMKFIISSILEYMDITENIDLECLSRLDTYEIPVYGQVMTHFGMKWKNDYILRKYTKYTITERPINLHQYVDQYIRWNYYGLS